MWLSSNWGDGAQVSHPLPEDLTLRRNEIATMRMCFNAAALTVCSMAAILAGCSGGGSAPGSLPQTAGAAALRGAIPSGIAPAATTPLTKHAPPHDIFVADQGSTLVKEIPKACRFANCVEAVGSGIPCPTWVSLDSSLNIYVSRSCDYGTAIYKLAPGCNNVSCASTVPGNYLNPWGTAIDRHGNLYVADYSHGYVDEVPAGCKGSSCVVELGGNAFVGPGYYPWDYGPTDVGLDKHGDVYVSSRYYVSEMPPNCNSASCVTRLGGGWSTPNSVSLDHQGNVYVDDLGNNEIKEMPPHCNSASCVKIIMGGLTAPWAAKADLTGNVYVTDSSGGSVSEIPSGCRSSSCMVTIGGGFSQPLGIAVGP